MAPSFLPPINPNQSNVSAVSNNSNNNANTKDHLHKKPKSFFEKERQYWIDVENLRLVRKIYKIDGSKNLSYYNPQMQTDPKPTSYSLKQAKDRKKIEFENQRILSRLSNLGTSHYSK